MALAPYYTGDTVPLKFSVSDASGGVTPSQARVTILKPNHKLIPETDASIQGNIVSYIVPITATVDAGKYIAYFILALPSSLIRTYKMEFEVIHNP